MYVTNLSRGRGTTSITWEEEVDSEVGEMEQSGKGGGEWNIER